MANSHTVEVKLQLCTYFSNCRTDTVPLIKIHCQIKYYHSSQDDLEDLH